MRTSNIRWSAKQCGGIVFNPSFHPVVVECNYSGKCETISSVREAAAFLMSGWPRKKASLYVEARVLCYEAQNGLASVDHARLGFVEAAIEADIYVKEGH